MKRPRIIPALAGVFLACAGWAAEPASRGMPAEPALRGPEPMRTFSPHCRRLDLICGPQSLGGVIGIRTMSPRLRGKGYAAVIRVGPKTDQSPTPLEVQLSTWANMGLFIAAVIMAIF